VSSRTVPEVCAECGGDMEVAGQDVDHKNGSFYEEWYCPDCDDGGTVTGYEGADPATFEASGCCRD